MAKKYTVGKKKYTLAQMLANPRLRGQLPDSKLPANLLAMRKTNQANKKPAGPGSSMTVGDINSILDTQFGGQSKALAQRQTEIPTWFNNYRAALDVMQADQTQRTAGAVQATQTFGANAAANTQAANTQTNNQTAAANAISGAGGVDAAALQRQQAAENVRQTGIGNWAGLAQQLGNNQSAFNAGTRTQSYGMENNAKSELGKAYSDLFTKRASSYQDLLAGEQKSKLEAAAFNLKTTDTLADNSRQDASLQETTRSHKANETAAEKRLRLAQEKAADAKNGKGNGKDQYGNTLKQRRSVKSDYRKAANTAATMKNSKDPNVRPKTLSQAISTLSGLYPNVDIDVITAAAEKTFRGKVNSKRKRSLKQIGLRL